MNRNNEVALVVSDAFVMYYDNLLGKWIASGVSKSVTIAKVQLLQNVASNQFRILAWNPINKEVLVNSVLYHNLRYQKAHATFHEWRDADTQLVYGLHFADTKDASIFGDVISKVFKSLELIYQQCRELQAQIRATSSIDQSPPHPPGIDQPKSNLQQCAPTRMFDPGNNCQQFNQAPKAETYHFSQVNRSHSISIAKPPSNLSGSKSNPPHSDFGTNLESDLHSPHNYENINSILLQQSAMKSLSSGPENVEFSNRCQSSSDDSVRGLKRQPSSTSSGYATVASMTDQYSPTPGLTSSFSMVAEALNKCISDSKTKNQNSADYSMGLISPTEAVVAESQSSSFAAQLQSMIQLRKVNQSSLHGCDNTGPSQPNNSKFDFGARKSEGSVENTFLPKDNQTFVDLRSSTNSKIAPVDDIMSEMKMKLQRRKQLIDGHTDTNYSSSTEKSDVCSSSASDAGSFVGNMDQSLDRKSSPNKPICNIDGSNSKTKMSELSMDNKTLLEDEDRSSQISDDFRDISRIKKMSTGDIIQSSTSTTVLASKKDLDRIKKEMTDDIRRELMDVKKEVLNAIRHLKIM